MLSFECQNPVSDVFLRSTSQILQAAALVSLGKPEEIGALSIHLTSSVSSEHKSSKEQVSKRLRDVLMKEWTLVGIPLAG